MKTPLDSKIVILGFSTNKDRYSWKAKEKLKQSGYENLVGVHPRKPGSEDITVHESLNCIIGPVHTLTVYIGASKLEGMVDEIMTLKPKRIILNPGTENKTLIAAASSQGVEVIEACTLVLLSTKEF